MVIRYRDVARQSMVALYDTHERWYGIQHDTPCLGAINEVNGDTKFLRVYLREEDAIAFAETKKRKILGELRAMSRRDLLVRLERKKISSEFFQHDCWSYVVDVKKVNASMEDIISSSGKNHPLWNRSEGERLERVRIW